jgi:hypothetical protein
MPDLKVDPGMLSSPLDNLSCKCGASYLFTGDAERCCELCSVCGAVKCHSQEMNRAWNDNNYRGDSKTLCPHPEQEGHGETCTCMGSKFRIKGSGTPRTRLARQQIGGNR